MKKSILTILLFLFVAWHLEAYSSLEAIQKRLQFLSTQKDPSIEVCSIRIIPVERTADVVDGFGGILKHGNNTKYNLLYETYSDQER